MQASEEATFPAPLKEAIEELTTHYPHRAAALIPAMLLVQERFGYISSHSIDQLSEILEVPPAEIMGTLTFYTMLRTKPAGRFHVSVCKNLSCTLLGARSLLEYLEGKLGVGVGETTDDGVFTLLVAECLGACNEAPVMEVDGEYHYRLTPERIDAILEEYRKRANG
jgi:NADH-quinone oxidoreductase subunit E